MEIKRTQDHRVGSASLLQSGADIVPARIEPLIHTRCARDIALQPGVIGIPSDGNHSAHWRPDCQGRVDPAELLEVVPLA